MKGININLNIGNNNSTANNIPPTHVKNSKSTTINKKYLPITTTHSPSHKLNKESNVFISAKREDSMKMLANRVTSGKVSPKVEKASLKELKLKINLDMNKLLKKEDSRSNKPTFTQNTDDNKFTLDNFLNNSNDSLREVQ